MYSFHVIPLTDTAETKNSNSVTQKQREKKKKEKKEDYRNLVYAEKYTSRRKLKNSNRKRERNIICRITRNLMIIF